MSERWSVLLDAEVSEAADDNLGLAVDIDPRARTLRLGARVLSGGGPEFWYSAVMRRFFEGDRAEWAPVCRWLGSTEAAELLAIIEQGYQGETLWTGDRVASWSPAALEAVEALRVQISAILRG